ncbi:MAG: helix-turn-helix transcriptional regulator [Burkholderiales bacterium]|jgi:XRE family aerobic/anaerobic benzoate catabolism transcriptional regulator
MGAPLSPPSPLEPAEQTYLARLGERVRGWRLEQGVTRKSLALASGVSERYLAQLESGHGNISVLLLRKVAQAMQVPIEDLARENGELPAELALLMRFAAALPPDKVAAAHRLLQAQFGSPRKRRIALLGLRGAGKSSLGARLAEVLGAPFVELDREVEREAGSNLGEVFSIYGQDAYRRFERRALERVLRQHDRAVIATGGSLVTDQDNYDLLRERCYCVWLKASPEEHMSRVISQGDMRPFKGRSAALDEIRRLLADRDRLYARADAILDTSGKPVRQSVAQLRNLVSKEEK